MSIAMWLALVTVFLATALVTGALTSYFLSVMSPERRRLAEVTRLPPVVVLPEGLATRPLESRPGNWGQFAALIPRSKESMDELRRHLARAGIRSDGAPVVYTFFEWVVPVIAALVPFLWLRGSTALLAGAAGAVVTFFLPGLVLERRIVRRRREIANGLPDALDLLVVCIEAGSSIDQAILKTAEELTIAYPALADELRTLNTEIRAGLQRIEAFKNLARRTQVDDVRAMVAMLVQTDRFGTSIGQALRTHADTSRTKRRQRAEEQAAKLAVKLVFPLVLCFFPAFFVVVLGPVVIEFLRTFGNP